MLSSSKKIAELEATIAEQNAATEELNVAYNAALAAKVTELSKLQTTVTDLTSKLGITPQFESSIFAAPPGQIGAVGLDQLEPGFIEKLSESRCAGALVLLVWITVGFNADDALNHRFNGHFSSRLVWYKIMKGPNGIAATPT